MNSFEVKILFDFKKLVSNLMILCQNNIVLG